MKTTLLKNAVLACMLATLFTTTTKAFTAVTSGNWSSAATWGGTAPGGSVNGQNINIPNGITVTLDMDVSFSGVLSTFTVDGTLTDAGAHGITISQGVFAGAGTVTVNRLTFTSSFASITSTGTLMLHSLVNSGASLSLSSVTNISDTLNLDGGNLTVASSANLTVKNNATIRINNGIMSINGGIFNSNNSYSVIYVGSSKTSGIELNSTMLKDLYIQLTDNTQSVTLNSNLVINGVLHLSTGMLDFSGKQITLYGDINQTAGAMFTSNSASNMVVQASNTLTSGLTFSSGSSMNNLTITKSGAGNVKLMSALSVGGYLRLMNGSFSLESGSALTMNAGSTIHIESGSVTLNSGSFNGTASYNVEYMGTSTTASGMELSGSGLNNLTINLTSGANQVTLSNDATLAGSLTMKSGKFNLNDKHLTLNGTMTQDSSAKFIGSSNAQLDLNLTSANKDTLYFDSSNQNLKKLSINTFSPNGVMLGSDLTINGTLNLVSGKMEVANHNLILQSTALVNGYNDTRYIVTSGSGTLQMYINASSAYVTFPIGTSSGYSPANIQQTASGTAGNFMIRAMNGVYAQGTSGYNSASSGSVVNKTWMIAAATGVNVNANLKLAWTAASEVNGFDRTTAYISHYTNSAWDSYAKASATVGANNTYEISRTGITSLSPFAVADANSALSVDNIAKTYEEVQVYPNPSAMDVIYTNVSTQNPFLYEIIDLRGRTVIRVSNTKTENQFDISTLDNGYYFMKITNLNNNKTVTKRFVKAA